MGRALSEVIAGELTGVPGLYVLSSARIQSAGRVLGVRPISAPGISAEQQAALASDARRVGYGAYWISGGRLETRLTLRDSSTQRATMVLTASAAAGDVLGAATALARQISASAGPYATRSPAALEAYSKALEEQNAGERETELKRAIAADPNFGSAYRLGAEAASPQDHARALEWLRQGRDRGDAIPAVERARMEAEQAALRGDAAARQQALAAVAKADAGDPAAWRSLAEVAFARHDYRQAADAYQKSLAIEPEDAAALNQLGYAAAYAGDLGTAVSALRRYAALRPSDANALDSLGDVYMIRGKLREAGDAYLQAARKDANFLGGAGYFKAAMARLMAGDVASADALSKQFTAARAAAHDPAAPLYEAEWQWISGRRKAGYEAMETFAGGTGSGALQPLASRAWSQLAIWSLMLGDRAKAQQASMKAAALADQTTAAEATIARFIAQPSATPEEWRRRADVLAPTAALAAVKDIALAYALLLDKQAGPTAEVLKRMYEAGAGPSQEGAPVLLAWSYLALGKTQEAAPLLELNPTPPITGVSAFTSLYFPRLYFLRGEVARQQGKADGAKADYKLFLQLSGDQPFQWGEEKKAKAAI
jgi:Flp pilus assembly protein TadD